MSKKRWATRTIRNGRVKIHGVWFRPSERWEKCDGRLDGMRYLFGRYFTGEKVEPFVFLWGSDKLAKMNPEEYEVHDHSQDPEVMEDGVLPWMWWYAEGHERLEAVPS